MAAEPQFFITERTTLQFRWEVFNLSNTAQFGLPSGNYSGGTPGVITSLAGDPRIMQFALRSQEVRSQESGVRRSGVLLK